MCPPYFNLLKPSTTLQRQTFFGQGGKSLKAGFAASNVETKKAFLLTCWSPGGPWQRTHGLPSGKPANRASSLDNCGKYRRTHRPDEFEASKETYLPERRSHAFLSDMLVAFTNTKGGVGKSTLAVHLAVWLFDQGFQVAVLDCDKQRSSSQWVSEAEPQIAVRVADTPEIALKEARGLLRNHDFVIGDGPAGLDDLSRTLLVLADLAICRSRRRYSMCEVSPRLRRFSAMHRTKWRTPRRATCAHSHEGPGPN